MLLVIPPGFSKRGIGLEHELTITAFFSLFEGGVDQPRAEATSAMTRIDEDFRDLAASLRRLGQDEKSAHLTPANDDEIEPRSGGARPERRDVGADVALRNRKAVFAERSEEERQHRFGVDWKTSPHSVIE
jgi:hypothetical protein